MIPIPIHVGTHPPAHWDEIDAHWLREGMRPSVVGERPDLADHSLVWAETDFSPQWIGDETADCIVALQPSIFHNSGADERTRFLAGAKSRGEVAVIVSKIGKGGPDGLRPPFSRFDDSVPVETWCNVSSRSLGRGGTVKMAEGLTTADRDLALRLKGLGDSESWSALELQGTTTYSSYGSEFHPPVGSLQPVLVSQLGETVVGAWVSPDDLQRHYLLPEWTPWALVLDWLAAQALPQLVPGALRRARSPLAWGPEFLTPREVQVMDSLSLLERDHQTRKSELEAELARARSAANEMRFGLLYGTGKDLETSVASLLTRAGIKTLDLDDALRRTASGDLLCTYQGQARLVEVKSSSGMPSETLYYDLLRHIAQWPALEMSTVIEGGALILNHQHRLEPEERSTNPYSRSEFLASQKERVITTLALFHAWREEDWGAIRQMVFDEPVSAPPPIGASSPRPKFGFWRRRADFRRPH